MEWKKGGELWQWHNYQIFEQQAAQGYYEDARGTGCLFKRAADAKWSVIELTKIQAKNRHVSQACAGTARNLPATTCWR